MKKRTPVPAYKLLLTLSNKLELFVSHSITPCISWKTSKLSFHLYPTSTSDPGLIYGRWGVALIIREQVRGKACFLLIYCCYSCNHHYQKNRFYYIPDAVIFCQTPHRLRVSYVPKKKNHPYLIPNIEDKMMIVICLLFLYFHSLILFLCYKSSVYGAIIW